MDENTYQRTFVKRTEKGMWSQNTLRYAKEEMEKGRMSEFGKKMYELGLKKKPHDWDVPKNLEAPEELRKELEKRKLWVKFQELSKSKKRIFLRWLLSAKRDGTRDKRVKEILKMVRTNGTLGVKDV